MDSLKDIMKQGKLSPEGLDEVRKLLMVSFEVFFHDNDCCERHIGWQMNRIHFQGNICGTGRDPQFKPSTTAQMVVIGNIHDNPELLKMK